MNLHPPIRLAAAATLVVGLGVLSGALGAGASTTHHDFDGGAHALFVETDAPAANTVISYTRASDGTISYAGTFATGGLGAKAANAVADPLASQGGLTLIDGGQELLAVNPGSDTVTVFAVDGTQLRLLQQVPSGGEFPDSIAAHGDLVAVLNAGGSGSVVEFAQFGGRLVALPGESRTLGLANTNPPDFVHGPGEVGYTPDGRHLIVTTKSSTNAYDVFSVSPSGALGAAPVATPADNAVPFAFSFDAQGNLVGVEASTSSLSTYRVNADGSLTSLGTVSDGAKALCWVSAANGYFFGDNAGSATVSSFTETAGGAPVVLNATAASAHAGTTDSTVSPDGGFLYVESGGAGTLDVFAIGAGGTLTPIETVFNVPVAAEGIAAS